MENVESSTSTKERIFGTITKNPWDEGVLKEIIAFHQKETPGIKHTPFDTIGWEDYLGMVQAIKSSRSLEEKYRLLAQEALILPRFVNPLRPYKRVI